MLSCAKVCSDSDLGVAGSSLEVGRREQRRRRTRACRQLSRARRLALEPSLEPDLNDNERGGDAERAGNAEE